MSPSGAWLEALPSIVKVALLAVSQVEFKKSKAFSDELTFGGASKKEKLFSPFELKPSVAFRPVIVTVTAVMGPVMTDDGTVTVDVSVTFVELFNVGPKEAIPEPEKVQVSVLVPVVQAKADAPAKMASPAPVASAQIWRNSFSDKLGITFRRTNTPA